VSPGTPTLRRAAASDAAAVRALVRAAYAKWVPVIGREPKPMGADYEKAVVEHRVDLAYLGAELAALIETISAPDHLLIENVAVAPAFQGRGLGRFLMAHAERLAAAQGQAELRLYTKSFAENVGSISRSATASTAEESAPPSRPKLSRYEQPRQAFAWHCRYQRFWRR
jgi:GNAT superfamily N-acetyltransferase